MQPARNNVFIFMAPSSRESLQSSMLFRLTALGAKLFGADHRANPVNIAPLKLGKEIAWILHSLGQRRAGELLAG